MKTSSAVLAIALLASAASQAATIVPINNTESGRIGNTTLAGVNWNFGTTDAGTAANSSNALETLWSTASPLVGDNPSNIKFAQMWRFDITQPFIDDLDNGHTVNLEFSSANINNGGGAPGTITVLLLSGDNDRVAAALATPLATLGTISGSTANTAYSMAVTNLPTLAAGDRLWFGLIDGLSTNGAANNINMNKSGAQLVTVIPEPTGLPLLIGGIGMLALVRRRK
jgi:hypothetical protein